MINGVFNNSICWSLTFTSFNKALIVAKSYLALYLNGSYQANSAAFWFLQTRFSSPLGLIKWTPGRTYYRTLLTFFKNFL